MAKRTADERTLRASFERGEWQAVPRRAAELRRYRSYAKATLKRDMRLQIRISAADLEALRARALTEGVPSTTLIANVLHKFVSGQFIERSVST